MSDFCYHLTKASTEYVKAAGQVAYTIGKGVAKGVTDYTKHGVEFIKDLALHPIEKTQDIVCSLYNASCALGNAIQLAYKDPQTFRDKTKNVARKIEDFVYENPDEAISKITELVLPFGAAKLPLGMIMLGSLKKTGSVFKALQEQKAVGAAVEKIKNVSEEIKKVAQPVQNVFKNVTIRKTRKETIQIAEAINFIKTNYRSHGQLVFKKGNRYITPDVDGHNGGVWKMADSVKNLGSKKTRLGTFDINLNKIGE